MIVSRPLLIALVVSATVNVFLVGGITGVALARKPAPVAAATSPSQAERPARPPLWAAGEGLSPERRSGLRQALREANQKSQPTTRDARIERLAAMEALRAQPYDAAAASRHLEAARRRDSVARANVEAALVDFAGTLTPAERSILAEGLTRVYAPRKRPGVEP
jgi:uncharacterized membrane protein